MFKGRAMSVHRNKIAFRVAECMIFICRVCDAQFGSTIVFGRDYMLVATLQLFLLGDVTSTEGGWESMTLRSPPHPPG